MDSITVLMSTYNGERYLKEQIESIIAQEKVDVRLIVRDDGSLDRTKAILDDYQARGALSWYTGENLRPAKSFLHLLFNSPDSDFYAFSDQDDVWDSDKLNSAIDCISKAKVPALYCSDTLLVDANLGLIRQAGIQAECTFVESLISNPVTGCTMVFNKALRDIVLHFQPNVIDMHDWWIYRICMAVDGFFYFDSNPHIKYRQHENNVIGGQGSKWNRIKRRIGYFFHGLDGIRYLMSVELYKGYSSIIPLHNKLILEKFVNYKKSILDTMTLATTSEIVLKNKTILHTFKKAVLLRKY